MPLLSLLVGGAARLAVSPGPPPCRRLPFDPLPVARLDIGWGRGAERGARLPGPEYSERFRTWAYAGLRLTWSFDPLTPAECAARLARWHETAAARRARIGALAVAWRRAAQRLATATDVDAAATARIELARIEALLESTSGVPLRAKEGP